MDNAKIYLCKADCSILGTLTGIKTDTCNLTKNATDYWEITFEVERFIEKNGKLVQSEYYDSVDEMMKLYLDSDDEQVFFVIDSEPVINGESYQETKTVTAHSIECELNDIYLSNFKINCGTYDSQEYLATDNEGNFNNIDDYTGLPKEYISLVNYDNHQLSVMHLALQGTDWTVKGNIDPDACSIKKSFESSDSIYSFLMKKVSPAASVIFEFDRKHKQIGIVKVENYGKDTGIFVTMRNLMNSFEISSSSQDAIMTKLIPTGANNLGIEQVNFGKDYITNLDYFMNTLNEYGDYKFVSTELHDKYNTWKNYRETEKVVYNGKEYTRRELYIELTKLYNKTMLEINELHNRLPNDGCVIDYKTFSLEELKLSLNAYNKALVTLITLYKDEYGVTEIGDAPDYSPTPSTAVNIKDTPYWYDYYAYKEKIIPQVEQSLKMYCQTDSNGNLMTDSDGNFIELEFGNPDYYADETIIKSFDDYLFEWSLYGLDELESKKKALAECANVLYNECFIASGTQSDPVYRTADDNGWNSLTDSQKKEFTSKDAFISKLNQYLDYMSFDDSRNNSITNKIGKGVVRQCEDAITERKNEIATIEINQNQYNSQRAEIANSVTLENFKVDGTLLFTEKELNIIKSMIRTQDFSDDYILTTNLDDVVTTVDKQEELYQSAITKLYEISQPQYSFSTELDNLYYLEEFKSYREPFEVGNFIRVGLEIHEDLYDNNFVKLRLISISYNPLEESEDLSVEFSTMTKSLYGISDLAFLIDKESSRGSTSSSSGSSSSSGGTYGNNDANVQISNNMLNALLKTEMFGTTVTDVVLDSMKANKGNFNTLFAHSGVFSILEAGRIKVSGDCLFDRIQSNNYIFEKQGSYLNLVDGTFDFAGGKLKYDPSTGLVISGYANDTDLSKVSENLSNLSNGLTKGITTINGGCLTTGNIKSKDWNGSETNLIGNTKGSIICLDNGKFNFAGGKLKWDGTNLSIDGNGKFTGSINVNNNFIVDENGNVATNGDLTISKGSITATSLNANISGSIAGWNFDSSAFYKNSNLIGIKNGRYFGEEGLSIGNYFVVKNSGFYQKNDSFTSASYSTNFTLHQRVRVWFDDVEPTSASRDEALDMTGGYLCISFVNIPDNTDFGFQFSITMHHHNIVDPSIETDVYRYKSWKENTDNTLSFDITSEKYYDNYIHAYLRGVKIKAESFKLVGNGNGSQYLVEYCEITNFLNATFNSAPYGTPLQVYKIEIFNKDNQMIYEQYGNQTEREKGFLINSFSNTIMTNNVQIEDDSFNIYNDTEFKIIDDTQNTNIVKITKSDIVHKGLSTSSTGDNLIISSSGNFYRKSSSSRRYKNTIRSIRSNCLSSISPSNLYDINVVTFKYNDDYLLSSDQRYQEEIPGFIAEDIYEKYPIACNLNLDGKPEMWDINIMFPAALALIQEQHEDIELLKEEIEELKNSK